MFPQPYRDSQIKKDGTSLLTQTLVMSERNVKITWRLWIGL